MAVSGRDRVHDAWYDLSVRVVLSLVVAVVVNVAAGCDDCRAVEPRSLDFECDGAASFRGELHLDSAGTWRAFLSDSCLPTAVDARIDELVAAVDFNVDAVFVARGARLSTTRCLVAREAESIAACTDGLRIIFDDEEIGPDNCPGGDWTVALLVPRADVRSALAANEDTVVGDQTFE